MFKLSERRYADGGTARMSHTCHAINCEVSVPPKMFMCLRHWRMVPRPLQREVTKMQRQLAAENDSLRKENERLRGDLDVLRALDSEASLGAAEMTRARDAALGKLRAVEALCDKPCACGDSAHVETFAVRVALEGKTDE
jgi:hypothetical protein